MAAAEVGADRATIRCAHYLTGRRMPSGFSLGLQDLLGPPDDTPIDQFSPTVEDMAQAENVVRGIIASLDVPMSPGMGTLHFERMNPFSFLGPP